MARKKSKPVASVSSHGPVIMGASDVIRWGDVMTIQGYDIQVSKAAELGIKNGLEIAGLLKEDLQSETGLLLTFPMMILMNQLQRIESIGTGEKLLEMVKPD